MTDKELLQISIGKRIKEIRIEHGITQQDLAYACGFDKANLRRIEIGNTNPTIWTLKKIAIALNVSLESLVAES